MATPRDIRRLALLALYQLDLTASGEGSEGAADVRASLDDLGSMRDEGLAFDIDADEFRDADRDRAFTLASAAYAHRAEADAAMLELAPDWPAGRQAAIDRAILRLAHYEMTRGDSPPKAVVNEAVELAKAFGTEKSPAFVNGLLDKILKRVLADRDASAAG